METGTLVMLARQVVLPCMNLNGNLCVRAPSMAWEMPAEALPAQFTISSSQQMRTWHRFRPRHSCCLQLKLDVKDRELCPCLRTRQQQRKLLSTCATGAKPAGCRMNSRQMNLTRIPIRA